MTLSVNYTEPTGIMKQPQATQGQIVPPIPSPIIYGDSIAAKQLVSLVYFVPSENHIVILGRETTLTTGSASLQTPDMPPFGKMLLSTFPSIYQQAGASSSLAATPREFPPIFIVHTTTD